MNDNPTPTLDTVRKLERLVLQQAMKIAELQLIVREQAERIRAMVDMQYQRALGFGVSSTVSTRKGV